MSEPTATPSLDLSPALSQDAPACVTISPERDANGAIDWQATTGKLQEAYADYPDSEAGPAWQSALNTLKVQERERELLESFGGGGPEEPSLSAQSEIPVPVGPIPPSGDIPGLRISEWITELYPGPGRVIDEERAVASPCTRVAIGDDYFLTSNPWIAGWLDAEQEQRYCVAGLTDVQASPEDTARLRALTEAALTCSVEANEQPDIFFTCLGKELRKAGVR